MSPLALNALCLALVLGDLVARAWRIQWLVRGLGYPLSFRDAFVTNALGEAACALTPLRLGGEPARLAGLLRGRVPATAAFVAIGYEVLAAWPVIIVLAAAMVLYYGAGWWAAAGEGLVAAVTRGWPWVVGIAALTLAAGWWVHRRMPSAVTHIRRPLLRTLAHWRRMPAWPLLASVPLTAVNVVSRVAVLPLLALALPEPPALSAMVLGSFALLYSQLILPTPSGAGAVELGFLAGAAGSFGEAEAALLLAWRLYTTGIGLLLGVWLALRIYGWEALRGALRTGRAAERSRPA